MKVEVGVEKEENKKPKLGLNLEFNNEYIGLAVVGILAVTSVVIVKTICKSNSRRGTLDICGVAKLRIGK